jgi:hypothetical protein
MERILALGEAAVPALLAALDEWADDEEGDRLLVAILLGEIRHPDAAVPLAGLLRDPEDLVLSAGAAEALAKIGAPAVPALVGAARNPDPRSRLYAYGALGAIPDPEAYRVLLKALEEDPGLAFVVATGVACQGGEAAVPALLRALERCPTWQRSSVEEAIRMAHEGGEALPSLGEDWRLRYRLLPGHRVIDPGPLGIAAILFGAKDEMPDRSHEPVRSLEEILAAVPDRDTDLCEHCGAPLERRTGIPACPDDAAALALAQGRMLEFMGTDQGVDDLTALLEIAEGEYLWLVEEEEEAEEEEEEDPQAPEDGDYQDDLAIPEEEREEALILIRTCRWLLEQGVETVREGRARLLAEAGMLADRFGDPQGLLAPGPKPVVSTARMSRNDPCPCGSGRKYKKCCGKAEPANLRLVERPGEPGPAAADPGAAGFDDRAGERGREDYRGPDARLHEGVCADLFRMACNVMSRREQEEALVRYLGPEVRGKSLAEALPDMDPPWAAESFLEWLLFDYRRRSGRILAEEHLGRKGWTLDARFRALLKGSAASFMSLYRVEEVRPEKGLTLRDLFQGGTVEVLERMATRQLVRWDLLAARLLDMDGGMRFTGGIIPFESREKDTVLLALEEEYVRYRAAHPHAPRGEFLKENGDLLYRIARASLDRPLPSLVTHDGEPVMFCRARYRVNEAEGLAERIEAIPEMEEVEGEEDQEGQEGQEGAKIFFRWVEPLDSDGPVDWGTILEPERPRGTELPRDLEDSRVTEGHDPDEEPGDRLILGPIGEATRSLGTIALEGDRLVLECSSESRLARGRALLEEHLAGAITHTADTVQDPWQALAEERSRGEKARPSSSSLPAELLSRLHREFMDRHYRTWVDEPVPGLGNKTPRESVVSVGGRSRVADIIREAERVEALRQRDDGYSYDLSWLWQELGLDPARD